MAGPSARLRAASSAVRRAALRLSDADPRGRGRRADARRPLCYTADSAWATSSVGRARARQARGRWFNSNVAHHAKPLDLQQRSDVPLGVPRGLKNGMEHEME